jgi:NADPH-dependent 2,4-dienoyl-CoA reductase/sulfur reductase-like enzyme
MSGAAEARRADADLEIVVLERGPDVAYSACGLPYWIAGEVADEDDLVAHDREYFARNRDIEVRTGTEAVAIDPAARVVRTAGGDELAYDALLVATGASPTRPSVPGIDAPGVLVLRDLASARELQGWLRERSPGPALLVGTGPIGLEMAEALSARGVAVDMIEVLPRALPALAEEIAAPVLEALAANRVTVRADAGLERIEERGRRLVATVDAEERPYDLVLLGTGVRPNAELAESAGCRLGQGGAIAVDRRGRTSVEGIWAAGDCATAWHRLLERDAWIPLATTANRQGRVAGRDIAGVDARFSGMLGSWVSTAFGVGFGATGLDLGGALGAGYQARALHRKGRDRSGYIPGVRSVWVRLVWDDLTGRLLGAEASGTGEVSGRLHVLAVAIGAGLTVAELAGADLGYVPPLSPLRDPVELAAAAAVGDAP